MFFKKKNKVKCPYCDVELEKAPQRKKKCPSCKNPIYPVINPYTNKQFYLTEDGKVEMEKIKERYEAEKSFFNDFNRFGLSKKYFEKRRKDYEKKARKLNREYNVFAFLSSIFNELSLKRLKQKDEEKFSDLSSMYYSMALLLNDYDQNFFNYLKESRKMDLYHFQQLEKETGVKNWVVITADKKGACDKCLEQNGKKFKIDEALKKMPIPVKDCGNEFCKCLYTAEVI